MSRIFPVPTRGTILDEICVVLDMEDYPNPKSLDPYSISEKITSEIRNEGYRGNLSISAYADEDTVSDEVRDDYGEAGISILAVDEPSKLLILSKNKKMEQDPNFSRFRKALEKKGFYVALALPDTLINLDGGGDLSVSHKKRCKCCPSTA